MPLRPRGGGTSTSHGRSYGIFQKAIQRRNVVAAVAAAKELPQLSLSDALELTMLVARKDSSRYPRVETRWLKRLLEEHPNATTEARGWTLRRGQTAFRGGHVFISPSF